MYKLYFYKNFFRALHELATIFFVYCLFANSTLEKEGEKFFQCEPNQNKLKKMGVLGLLNTPMQKFYSLYM